MQPIEHDVAAKVEEGVDGGREQRERRGGHGCVDWGDVTVSERAGVRGRIGGEGEGARTLERAEDEVAEEAGVDGDLDLREIVRYWDAGGAGMRTGSLAVASSALASSVCSSMGFSNDVMS